MLHNITVTVGKYGKDAGWINLVLEGKDIDPDMAGLLKEIEERAKANHPHIGVHRREW